MQSNTSIKYDKLVKNSALFAIGELSSKVMVFLMVPLYTYILSTDEYSICDLITTTVALATPFFSLVISEAVMRFALDKTSDKVVVYSIGFWVCIFGSVLLTILSYFVFLYIPLLKDYWLLFVLYFISFNYFSLCVNFLKGLERLKLMTITGIINTFLLIIFNVIFLIYFNMGIAGYLMASILSMFFSSLLIHYKGRLNKFICWFWRIPNSNVNEMFKYSIPMIPNSMMWWINNFASRYMVTYFVSNSANGLFSVAYKIPSIFSVISSIFMQAWQISVVEDFENEKGKRFFNQVYDYYLRINILLCSVIIASSKIIASVLFLKDFYSAWKLSTLLLIGYSFHSLAGFLGTIYTTVKKTKMLFVSTSIAAAINVILTLILLNLIGLIGACISTLVSYFVVFAIRRIDSKKYLQITVNSISFSFLFLLIIIQCFVLMTDTFIGDIISCFILLIVLWCNREFVVSLTLNLINRYNNKRHATAEESI